MSTMWFHAFPPFSRHMSKAERGEPPVSPTDASISATRLSSPVQAEGGVGASGDSDTASGGSDCASCRGVWQNVCSLPIIFFVPFLRRVDNTEILYVQFYLRGGIRRGAVERRSLPRRRRTRRRRAEEEAAAVRPNYTHEPRHGPGAARALDPEPSPGRQRRIRRFSSHRERGGPHGVWCGRPPSPSGRNVYARRCCVRLPLWPRASQRKPGGLPCCDVAALSGRLARPAAAGCLAASGRTCSRTPLSTRSASPSRGVRGDCVRALPPCLCL